VRNKLIFKSFTALSYSENQSTNKEYNDLQIILLPSSGWSFCFTFDSFRVQFSARIPSTLTEALLRLSASPRQNARPLTAEARVRSQAGSRGICGGKIGTGSGFCPSASVFPCQYHCTIASFSLSLALCDPNNGPHSVTQIMNCEDIRSIQPRPLP
jgi:hypothetical protein